MARALKFHATVSGKTLPLPDLSAFEFLTLRNDAVARRLIPPEVERFVAEDREHGGQLIDTLLAYADSDLNAKAAAERLLIHSTRRTTGSGVSKRRPAATCAGWRTSSIY